MLKRLNNKHLMFIAVKQVLDRNTAIWQPNAAVAAIVAEYIQRNAGTEEIRQAAGISTKGTTLDKNQEEELLADQIYEISSALYAMAVRTGNVALQQKTGHTESELLTAREGELVITANIVVAMARENLQALADYGIDAARADALEEQSARFGARVSAPRAEIVGRKAANAHLRGEFDAITDLLEHQLDRMMVQFRRSAPDFYTAYMSARTIVDHGLRHEKEDESEAAA